jgi:hypothetical protein
MAPFLLLCGLIPGQLQSEPPGPEPIVQSAAGPDRYLLMRSLQGTYPGWCLDGDRISVSGWTEGSFTASSITGNQLPMGFNYEGNRFLLQQNWLRVERQVDPKAADVTWGFRSDTILPGSDYRFTIARGLFDSQLTNNSGQPNLYGIDPVQFYGEAYLPSVAAGLDVKLGRFFCQFGAESIDTTQTPFASRSYTFIYNPFTHTGLLTTLKLSDAWSMQNGVVLGSDVFIDPAASPAYTGSIKWGPTNGRASAVFAVILGSGRYEPAEQFHNPEIFDIVLTKKLNSRLTWTCEGLYGFTYDVPTIGFANWFGFAQYLACPLSPQVVGNARLEFFDDCQGERTGFPGLYTAATAGITFKPVNHLLIRPEVRFDHNDSRPFQGKPDLFTAALDFVVRW